MLSIFLHHLYVNIICNTFHEIVAIYNKYGKFKVKLLLNNWNKPYENDKPGRPHTVYQTTNSCFHEFTICHIVAWWFTNEMFSPVYVLSHKKSPLSFLSLPLSPDIESSRFFYVFHHLKSKMHLSILHLNSKN